MVLNIRENSIDSTELKQRLIDEFKDDYTISQRSTFGVVLAKTNIVGVTVILKKDSMYISGNFPKSWMLMVYTFSLIILFFTPLIFYYLFLHKKMKAEEKKVGDFIKLAYANTIQQKITSTK